MLDVVSLRFSRFLFYLLLRIFLKLFKRTSSGVDWTQGFLNSNAMLLRDEAKFATKEKVKNYFRKNSYNHTTLNNIYIWQFLERKLMLKLIGCQHLPSFKLLLMTTFSFAHLNAYSESCARVQSRLTWNMYYWSVSWAELESEKFRWQFSQEKRKTREQETVQPNTVQ